MTYILKFTNSGSGDANEKPEVIIDNYKLDGPVSPNDPTPTLNPDATAASTSTTLLLYGRGSPNYGERIQENILHLMEHFYSDTPPVFQTAGQAWYDYGDTNPRLRIHDGSQWVDISTIFADAVPPVASDPLRPLTLGQLWYDTDPSDEIAFSLGQLKIYDGTNWISVAANYLQRSSDTMDVNANITFAGGEVLGLPATPSPTAATSREYVDTQDASVALTASTDLTNHENNLAIHLTPAQNSVLDDLETLYGLSTLLEASEIATLRDWNSSSYSALTVDGALDTKLNIAGGTITGALTVNNAFTLNNAGAVIYMDSQTSPDGFGIKRITCNDGGGNWNFRQGNYFSGAELYTTTGDGATAITLNGEGSSGQVLIKAAPQSTNAGDPVAWNTIVRIDTAGMFVSNNEVWHAGNDGPGSGLNADLLDGVNSVQFLRSDIGGTVNATISMNGNYITNLLDPVNPQDAATRQYVLDSVATITLPDAINISVTPANDISSTNVQQALEELDAEKLAKTGGTMTGPLEIAGTNPQIRLVDTTASAADFWLYADSNTFYVLTDRDSSGLYETPHPLSLVNSSSIGYLYGNLVITSANIGTQSVANANTLGGNLPSFYQDSTNQTSGTLPAARLTGTYNIDVDTVTGMPPGNTANTLVYLDSGSVAQFSTPFTAPAEILMYSHDGGGLQVVTSGQVGNSAAVLGRMDPNIIANPVNVSAVSGRIEFTSQTLTSSVAVRGTNSNSAAGNWDFFAGGVASNYGPFTGAHQGLIATGTVFDEGDIVVDLTVIHKRSISSTLLSNELSNTPQQKNIVGVLVAGTYSISADNISTLSDLSPTDIATLEASYDGITFNALGEGQINVVAENGDIQVGDYICSSSTAGKGMKQLDDLCHSYTVAKARESATWNAGDPAVKQIACIYVCG